jgi:hypothetical protein
MLISSTKGKAIFFIKIEQDSYNQIMEFIVLPASFDYWNTSS